METNQNEWEYFLNEKGDYSIGININKYNDRLICIAFTEADAKMIINKLNQLNDCTELIYNLIVSAGSCGECLPNSVESVVKAAERLYENAIN